MGRCTASKRNGSPCTLPAQGAKEFCWAHDPANAEARRKGASKGGSRKPSGDLHMLKQKLVTLGDDVLAGKAHRGDAAVAAQCYGVAIRALEALTKQQELVESRLVETQLKVEEQREITQRLEALEERLSLEKPVSGGGRWGA